MCFTRNSVQACWLGQAIRASVIAHSWMHWGSSTLSSSVLCAMFSPMIQQTLRHATSCAVCASFGMWGTTPPSSLVSHPMRQNKEKSMCMLVQPYCCIEEHVDKSSFRN